MASLCRERRDVLVTKVPMASRGSKVILDDQGRGDPLDQLDVRWVCF